LTLEAMLVVLAMAVAAHWLTGCAARQELPAPCDTVTLAKLTTDCHWLVRANCARDDAGTVDESCETLKQCDATINRWRDCDGGAP
jgi:hypothetical protein